VGKVGERLRASDADKTVDGKVAVTEALSEIMEIILHFVM
jgi:hypothetical protein